MTDAELQTKLKKLRAVDPQEIGGRADEVASLIEEILQLRFEKMHDRSFPSLSSQRRSPWVSV